MTRPIIVTGSASGIGAATMAWLAARGHAKIGIDVAGGDVRVDLGNMRGRNAMHSQVATMAPDGIAAIVACAGVASGDAGRVVAVNYFGAVATAELLRPLLAGADRPRVVVVASTAMLLPSDAATVAACLAAREDEAVDRARQAPDCAYTSSKLALNEWMRRSAISLDWAGQGIALNAVAPGGVKTPMTAPLLATEEGREIMRRTTPTAASDYGQPADLAEVIGFLATMETRYLLGHTIFVDGGTQVLLDRKQL